MLRVKTAVPWNIGPTPSLTVAVAWTHWQFPGPLVQLRPIAPQTAVSSARKFILVEPAIENSWTVGNTVTAGELAGFAPAGTPHSTALGALPRRRIPSRPDPASAVTVNISTKARPRRPTPARGRFRQRLSILKSPLIILYCLQARRRSGRAVTDSSAAAITHQGGALCDQIVVVG